MSGNEFQSGSIRFQYVAGRLEIRDVLEKRLIRTLSPHEVERLRELIAAGNNKRLPVVRVQVSDRCPIVMTLRADRLAFTARVVNLSMTGALVIVSPEHIDVVRSVAVLQAELTLHDLRFNAPATVKRVDRNEIGLFFPTCVRHDEVEPPAGLVKIIMSLQRSEMVRRAEEDTDDPAGSR
ncbi:MAG: hypothetical protein KDA96_14770 [Planctomycetaceae bacterium]|nr:hypothetical protein [Planctomycetaceae bacterium]